MAGQRTRKAKLTFSGAVRVPGATLIAGTYYFTALSPGYRTIVKIVRENGRFVTQFIGVHDDSHKPDHDVIIFGDHECGAGAIKSWFYPDGSFGVRFVYPEKEAALIAASCNEPVPEPHENTPTASELQNYNVYLMTPQKREEAYKF